MKIFFLFVLCWLQRFPQDEDLTCFGVWPGRLGRFAFDGLPCLGWSNGLFWSLGVGWISGLIVGQGIAQVMVPTVADHVASRVIDRRAQAGRRDLVDGQCIGRGARRGNRGVSRSGSVLARRSRRCGCRRRHSANSVARRRRCSGVSE